MRPGSAPAPRSAPTSCAPPRRATAPASSRPRHRRTGSSRPWPTPPASCTAPPPPSAPPGPAWARSPATPPADYLIQHASRERRYARVPASTWDAVLSHIRDPADAARLADSARSRLLYRYAIPLYRHAADAGDGDAAWQLADLLAQRGDLDGSCAPGPTPATGTPPAAGRAAGRARRPGRGRTDPARPGRRRRQGRRLAAGRAAGQSAATWTRPSRSARPGRRRRQGRRRSLAALPSRDLDEALAGST